MVDKKKRKSLGQFFTPAWAAEILFDAHFSHLGPKDLLWEPTCGRGNSLAAVPAYIPALGSEIDAALAADAARLTGRTILTGDCRTVELPSGITSVFGNPPFDLDLFEELMERCAGFLKNGQQAGFVIPAYFYQTSETTKRLARAWTIKHEIIPRDLFHGLDEQGLSKPLLFSVLTRDFNPRLIGFRLFDEVAAVRKMPDERRESLRNAISGPRSVWRQTIGKIIGELGGTAKLDDIYKALEGRRPTGTEWWRQQARKVCQEHFVRVEEATYALPQAA